jgi:hypothetical protein
MLRVCAPRLRSFDLTGQAAVEESRQLTIILKTSEMILGSAILPSTKYFLSQLLDLPVDVPDQCRDAFFVY